MDNSIISNEIIALVKRATDDAYKRGRADEKREILKLLGGNVSPADSSERQHEDFTASPAANSDTAITDKTGIPNPSRKRAPRGLVGKLITKAIKRAPSGLTPIEIEGHAETDEEKMIKVSSIRGELKRREGKLYRESGGRWFLIGNGEGKSEATGNDLGGQPPGASVVSTHAKGREAVPGGGP